MSSSLVAMTAICAAAASALPTFDLRADEIFNLVYQLDCLSQGEGCAFHAL